MSTDDPFEPPDDPPTVIMRPTPGGKTRRPLESQPATPATSPSPAGTLSSLDSIYGVNPVASAAANLISLALPLRQTAQHPDPDQLFTTIVTEINRFQERTAELNVGRDDILIARYLLCAFIDEHVMATPWGSQSHWSGRSLLSQFHNEAWGGEKFFAILDRLRTQSIQESQLELLELIYILLSLGFQGKFRVKERGDKDLANIRTDLYELIRRQRGNYQRSLSLHWKGVEAIRSPLTQYIPIWAAASIGLGMLLIMFTTLLFSLNKTSDPVAVQLASAGKMVPISERQRRVPASSFGLVDMLENEIGANQLTVVQRKYMNTIILRGDDYFFSGTAMIKPQSVSTIEEVATALANQPGRIVISGHTDNIPTRTLRFPSNWDLARARAEAVADVLAETIPTERMRIESEAHSAPQAPNDSDVNRAKNRRVEITLYPRFGN